MSPVRPIVLVGLMLSGKTTVGARLAEQLRCPFVDLDEAIAERSGRSISEIFADDGESTFRLIEASVLSDVLARPGPRVVATGGGAVIEPSSRELLERRGFVVYLEAEPRALARRARGATGRPLLDTAHDVAEVLAALLEARRDLYLEVQHCRVRADLLGVEALTEAILRAYEAHADS